MKQKLEQNLEQNLQQGNVYSKAKMKFSTKTIAKVGVLGAISAIIYMFDFALPFAPSFYKLDFSEIPVLLGAFSLGPVAGVAIEFVKVLLKLIIKGTTTAGVGDLGNFLIGCALVLPAAVIYKKNKSFKSAIVGLIVGTIILAVVGSLMNYFVLIPFYVSTGFPLDKILAMGNAVNNNIVSLWTLVLYAVVPFNIVKGIIISIITMLVYKRLSPLLHR
jgi:riboflavin transporter FmnP